eukprot:JP442159.1.p4 GENE.JP442159.1~~JP442159.1.p4  ORF type:complete len:62 (+),score=0.53 JP442159.1:86-271(+)
MCCRYASSSGSAPGELHCPFDPSCNLPFDPSCDLPFDRPELRLALRLEVRLGIDCVCNCKK